jgi:hypothetical protein
MRSKRTIAGFIALSALAHVLVLTGVQLDLPDLAPDPPPLQARLEIAAAAPPPPARAAPPRQPAKPKRAAKKAPPPVMTAPATAAAPSFSVPGPEMEEPVPEVAEAAPEPAAPPAAEETRPETPSAPPAAVARRLPQKGQIRYALYLGNDRFAIGTTHQTWTLEGDRYRLTSVSHTTGVASLFVRRSLEYVSVGRLTEAGLRPDFFGTERFRRGKTEAVAARFDWNAGTLTFGEPARKAALTPDAQDLVSFMYQLGLTPVKPGHMELPITNGWRFERYQLTVGSEETLDTPIGALRAVPVRQVRKPGRESVELWLAPDYRWLPVRIRFFDRAGEPAGEQVVNEIRVSDD